jgi:hypothetical protein
VAGLNDSIENEHTIFRIYLGLNLSIEIQLRSKILYNLQKTSRLNGAAFKILKVTIDLVICFYCDGTE